MSGTTKAIGATMTKISGSGTRWFEDLVSSIAAAKQGDMHGDDYGFCIHCLQWKPPSCWHGADRSTYGSWTFTSPEEHDEEYFRACDSCNSKGTWLVARDDGTCIPCAGNNPLAPIDPRWISLGFDLYITALSGGYLFGKKVDAIA